MNSHKIFNAVVAGGLHPPWVDGITAYSKGLVTSLLEAGYTTTVFSSYDITLLPSLASDDAKRWNSTLSKAKGIFYFLIEKSPHQIMPKRLLIHALTEARNIDKASGFMLFHILTPSVTPLLVYILSRIKNLNKVKIVKYLLTPNVNFLPRLFYSLFNKGQTILQNMHIACSSQYVAKTFGINSYFLVRPGIDLNLYNPTIDTSYAEIITEDFKKELEDVAPLITYMGWDFKQRFPWKDIIDAIKKLRYEYCLRNVKLLAILKDVSYPESIPPYFYHYVKKLGLEKNVIVLRKNLSEIEKVYLLRKSNIVLNIMLSSTGFLDPPLSILEALSLNVPVITTRNLSLADIINIYKYGCVIEKSDPKKIAQCINEYQYKHINSREFIRENFSMRSQSDDIERMINSILN